MQSSVDTIRASEDRKLFAEKIAEIGEKVASIWTLFWTLNVI